jgi:hypothetical protein
MIDRIYVSEATLRTIEIYGQNNLTNVSGQPDEHLCVEFLRAQPPAAAASEELLREIAALKRYDPNGVRGFAKSTLTVNVPKDLFERIDAGIAAQKEQQPK